jgi:hypothetical protein
MCATSPTPLDSHIWVDADFEEEEDEVETEADRAIAALEAVRKKKEEYAKGMRWAEMQYPDPSKNTNPSAAVTTTGNAVVTAAPGTSATSNLPPPNLKKPASAMNPEEVRAEIAAWSASNYFPPRRRNSAPARRQAGNQKRKPHNRELHPCEDRLLTLGPLRAHANFDAS